MLHTQLENKLAEAKFEKTLIPIDKWLQSIRLVKYADVFKQYKNVQDMLHLTEKDLKNLGIKIGADRANIASSLYLLKERIQGKTPTKHHASGSPIGSNRSTPSHTPPSLVNHPDYSQPQSGTNIYEGAGVLAFNNRLQPAFTSVDFELHNQKEISRHLWYHGPIPRVKAENLLKENGDFLVRDSTTQKGDYVLSCMWKNAFLHFMVNRQCSNHSDKQPNHTRVQYQFEDVLFDTVPQLVSHYVKERKPVTSSSKALISNPVNRRISADSVIAAASANRTQPVNANREEGFSRSNVSINSQSTESSPFSNTSSSTNTRQFLVSGAASSRKNTNFKRTGSQPLLSLDDAENDDFVDAAELKHYASTENVPFKTYSSHNDNTDHSVSSKISVPLIKHARAGSEPVVLTGTKLQRGGVSVVQTLKKSKENTSDSDLSKPPPPKPSRVPTIKLNPKLDGEKSRPTVVIRNKQLYDDEKDYSDYDAVKSWPANMEKSVEAVEASSIYSSLSDLYDSPKGVARSVTRLRNDDARSSGSSSSHDSGYYTQEHTYDPVAVKYPDMNSGSKFELSKYNSQILTPDNKPLDTSAGSMIISMLLQASTKTLALHLTLLDLDLLKVIHNDNLGLGIRSGLELITLPHGSQMRKDTLQRFNCMKLFVATTILLTNSHTERARILHQWVQVAQIMKTQMGNLYGFSYIMDGVTSQPVVRLKKTWTSLQNNHQTSVLILQTKLKSTYTSLKKAGNALPLQNITLPYIIPLVELLERDNEVDEHDLFEWEKTDSRTDSGLDIILAHLDIARIITEQYGLYKVTSLNIIGSLKPERDILELLDTRMHMRFMFGAKGSLSSDNKGLYVKFWQVLSAMSFQRESDNTKESSL